MRQCQARKPTQVRYHELQCNNYNNFIIFLKKKFSAIYSNRLSFIIIINIIIEVFLLCFKGDQRKFD